MAITESEMNAIREMFMDAAADLLQKEKTVIDEMFKAVHARFDEVNEKLDELSKYDKLEARIARLENLTGFPNAKQ